MAWAEFDLCRQGMTFSCDARVRKVSMTGQPKSVKFQRRQSVEGCRPVQRHRWLLQCTLLALIERRATVPW